METTIRRSRREGWLGIRGSGVTCIRGLTQEELEKVGGSKVAVGRGGTAAEQCVDRVPEVAWGLEVSFHPHVPESLMLTPQKGAVGEGSVSPKNES